MKTARNSATMLALALCPQADMDDGPDDVCERCLVKAKAAVARLAAAGFKVVGREPTEAMVEIGSDAVYEVVDGYDFSVNKMAGAEVWRAMFDAAEPQEKP